MTIKLSQYNELLTTIKTRIRQAQIKAVLSVNSTMLNMYWDIGRMIEERQQKEGWGSAVIPKLSKDIRNELPEIKGFSVRNLQRMIKFYKEYSSLDKKMPQAVAQLPWGHNILLIEKVKNIDKRFWYMQEAIKEGWSRNILLMMIKRDAYKRQGESITNFAIRLPQIQSDLANQTLKDPYIFDFLTLEEPFHERELETELVKHLEQFLIELGQGFAFVGRQYHLDIGDNDFYIDLLFYHLKLRCFVVIELKKGEFKPEYAGKINFYCNLVDDILKHETDNQSIGLILCQDKNKVLAEYSIRGMNKPIGISEYNLTRSLPEKFKSDLPSIEEIEAELSNNESNVKKNENL
jgi:predicted nuclease of restriction endonuclease-like (RecB) superfamily